MRCRPIAATHGARKVVYQRAVGAHFRQPRGHRGRDLVSGYPGHMSVVQSGRSTDTSWASAYAVANDAAISLNPSSSPLALSVHPTTAAGQDIEPKSTTTEMLWSRFGSCRSPSPTGSFVTAFTGELPGRWPRRSRTVHRVTAHCGVLWQRGRCDTGIGEMTAVSTDHRRQVAPGVARIGLSHRAAKRAGVSAVSTEELAALNVFADIPALRTLWHWLPTWSPCMRPPARS